MAKLVTLYFSGTGNTRYAAKKMSEMLDHSTREIYSIEEKLDFADIIRDADDVMIAYPIYGGDMPIIMRRFLLRYKHYFNGKNIIALATQAGFSGDGGAQAIRYLKGAGAFNKASVHVNMPTNVDFMGFKVSNGDALQKTVKRAERRILDAAKRINGGRRQRTGQGFLPFVSGYFLQRIFFEKLEGKLRRKVKIDAEKCVRCGKCVDICPMSNFTRGFDGIYAEGDCTLCFRCVHSCPRQAITIFGKISEQYKGIPTDTADAGS